MSNIKMLSEDTVNKIAAGEVIERPASIVKELVENSIDANSTSITIEIKDAGKSLIVVTDNGIGILDKDLENVFKRHATSKITKVEDLAKINSLGFRGEAMPSISSVSEIELFTRHKDELIGSHIIVKNRVIEEKKSIGYPIGTSIKVKKLFYNTPAREKFLKSERAENNCITNIIEKIALSNVSISFKYISNGNIIFHTPGNGELLPVIQCLYGLKVVKMMIPIEYSNEYLEIKGFIGKPELTKGNSTYIIFSVNNRVIKNIMLKESVKAAYKSLLMNRRYPFSILNVNINPEKIDINVHPTKAEIKFADDRSVFNIIYYAINNALSQHDLRYRDTNMNNDYKIIKEDKIFDYKQNSVLNTLELLESVGNKKELKFKESLESCYSLVNENRLEHGLHMKVLETKFVIGQLFNTYILCQSGDEFFMVDQHAAHERIIYEKLIESKKKNKIEQQPLITPIIIELDQREMNSVTSAIDILNKLGFDIEAFGDNSIAIRLVPIIMGQPCSGAIISDLLDTVEEAKDNINALEEKALLQIACKSAIKANDALAIGEMEKLIEELLNTRHYFTCPHGRPTIISLNKYELEKKFKRRI